MEWPTIKKEMNKVLIIDKCKDCKWHQFDPYLEPMYWGKDCCMYWFWSDERHGAPRILENADRIPEWCQLVDDLHN